jgi:hypothetical protein
MGDVLASRGGNPSGVTVAVVGLLKRRLLAVLSLPLWGLELLLLLLALIGLPNPLLLPPPPTAGAKTAI